MTAEIPSFQEKTIDKANVVFYKLQIGFTKNNKRWEILKRYSEFSELDDVLRKIHPNIPKMPSKSFMKINDANKIEERRVGLSQYIKLLINRRDMRTSISFRKFINLDSNYPQS